MEFESILQAISTVGFPIVCCGILMYQNHTQTKNHHEETMNFAEALNKNTAAIEKLMVKIEKD